MEFTDSLSINAPMERVRAAGLDLAAATHARIEMGGGWFTKLMKKHFGGSFRKAIRKDHEALKAYIEKP